MLRTRSLAVLALFLLTVPAFAQESHEDKMAREHAGDEPVASPAVGAEPAAPVTTEDVSYADSGTGYLAWPKGHDGPLPGLIVIHEWWGLNDNIRAMTRQLAGEGYMALAVDMYGGEVASTPEKARELATAVRQNADAGEANLRRAHAFLKEKGATKIGTIGWCFGGGWSLQTGMTLAGQVDATIIYYGRLVTDPDALKAIQAPVLGIFGDLDRGIPLDSVRAFEKAMQDLSKDVDVHVYEGADHAFANPSGTRYQEEAARDAWSKTLAFLAEHLQGS